MCTVVLWTKVLVEFVSIERIAVIKKRKQNAMRVTLNVSASNNLLCAIVSRSGCEYFISSYYLSNLLNTVPNSFGISYKVLLGTSD